MAQRSDALRNRELVVRAAVEVFSTEGLPGTTNQVAAAAGVGKGMLFRHFPTRELLLEAAAVQQLEDIAAEITELGTASEDPVEALVGLIHALFAQRRRSRLIAGLLEGPHPPAVKAARESARVPLAALLRQAQDAGAAYPDVRDDDLYFLFTACVTQLFLERRHAAAEWERAAEFVLRAIGVDPASARRKP